MILTAELTKVFVNGNVKKQIIMPKTIKKSIPKAQDGYMGKAAPKGYKYTEMGRLVPEKEFNKRNEDFAKAMNEQRYGNAEGPNPKKKPVAKKPTASKVPIKKMGGKISKKK